MTLKPESGAKVLVNGQVIKSDTTLHHNDRYPNCLLSLDTFGAGAVVVVVVFIF